MLDIEGIEMKTRIEVKEELVTGIIYVSGDNCNSLSRLFKVGLKESIYFKAFGFKLDTNVYPYQSRLNIVKYNNMLEGKDED